MTTHRYLALDLLRGVAAVAVVIYHIGLHSGRALLPHGYLAVDFFFVLSGFVLADAYGARLASRRIRPFQFFGIRYRRLWPMAFLGTVVGVVMAVSLRAFWGADWIVAALNAAMIPDVLPGRDVLYPFNEPHWSLLHELVANYAYGVTAPLLSTRRLVIIALLGSIGVVAVPVAHVGADVATIARVAYGFPVGVLLNRLARAKMTFGVAPLAVALLIIFACPWHLIELPTILVLSPLAVWLGASAVVRSEYLASVSGRASYPLYALHDPIVIALVH